MRTLITVVTLVLLAACGGGCRHCHDDRPSSYYQAPPVVVPAGELTPR